MGIMAGHTTDARVGALEALAVGQAVRLEAHIHLTFKVTSDDRLPGAVTLSAKSRNIFRRHFSQLWRGGRKIALNRIQQMRARSHMAMVAGPARLQPLHRELAVMHRVAGVTAEASLGLCRGEFAAHGLHQRTRRQGFVADGGVEPFDSRVVADQTFIELPLIFKNPGLRALAEVPVNW